MKKGKKTGLHKNERALIIALIVAVIVIFVAIFTTHKSFAPSVDKTAKQISEEILDGFSGAFSPSTSTPATAPKLARYIEIIDSCGPTFAEACVHGRSGPSTASTSIAAFRNGIVLKISDSVETTNDAGEKETWHKIVFDEWLRYPSRAQKNMYVSGKYARVFEHEPAESLSGATPSNHVAHAAEALKTKRIVVDLSEQQLYAYEGDTLFMKATTSTGLKKTPTPRGTFAIYRKTPSRYMQGPIPGISVKEYDLPGVPWNLYFTNEGAVIHGAYWHNKFGQVWSNGCVNLPPEIARQLYEWAELGTTVTVKD